MAAGLFTPTEHHSPEMKKALRLSDMLVGKVLAADHIVIATPVYNYNVPAALKAWIFIKSVEPAIERAAAWILS